MVGPLLLDTDVLIDHLRKQPDAVAFLQGTQRPLRISVVTVAELYVGARDDGERAWIDRLVGLMEAVEVTPAIARQAGLWRRDYGRSHGTGLMDALIAASAAIEGCTLVTLNARHFPMLDAVLVPYRKP